MRIKVELTDYQILTLQDQIRTTKEANQSGSPLLSLQTAGEI